MIYFLTGYVAFEEFVLKFLPVSDICLFLFKIFRRDAHLCRLWEISHPQTL